MSPLLKGLANERVVVIKPSTHLPFSIEDGVVRLVDAKGHTIALVLDNETLKDIEEDLSITPKFLASLTASRASGRVPGSVVKRKLGFK